MKRQLLNRLQALEERSGALSNKLCITVIRKCESGRYKVEETVYGKNGRTRKNCFTLEAGTVHEAAKQYKEPAGCTDSIVFKIDYGETWTSEKVAERMFKLMTTEELRQIIAEQTDNGTWIDENGSEVSNEEYDMRFNQIMAKYAFQIMQEMGVPQKDMNMIETMVKNALILQSEQASIMA